MIHEDARNERIEFCDVEGVLEGEEIGIIEFRCGTCDRVLGTIRLDQLGPAWVHEVCQKRCYCGNDSGFRLSPNSIPDTPDKLKKLADELTGLKKMTAEKKWMIQELLKGRNLKLRFGVKRLK